MYTQTGNEGTCRNLVRIQNLFGAQATGFIGFNRVADVFQTPPGRMKDMNLATADGQSVSPSDCLHFLRRHGRLRAVALQALAAKVVLEAARDAGLTVSAEELQQASNRVRQRNGLGSADRTHQWLGQQGRSVRDFEADLEQTLLAEKLKDHLTRNRVADHFAARRDDYARVRLRVIVVPREDLARELLSQVRDDGRDFADIARQHSLHASRADGGDLGMVWRYRLPDAVAGAASGDVVGPLASSDGFQLFLVEDVRPPELDDATRTHVRDELFDRWLGERLKDVTFHPAEDL
jgi:parvulin-like peptidyl-prolyl isomerase